MTSLPSVSARSYQFRPVSASRVAGSANRRSDLVCLHRAPRRTQQILANKKHSRRCRGAPSISAISVTERYADAEAKDTIRPLRHPFAAWQRWWYMGATPQAELPQSQKFSRICARLWGIMKHSKTSLTFAITFMVRCTYLSGADPGGVDSKSYKAQPALCNQRAAPA